MAVGSDKQRITITVSNEMASKLDYYGNKMGINRSALCAYFIGQTIMTLDKSFEIVTDTLKDAAVDGLNGQVSIEDITSVKKVGVKR